MDVGQSSEFLNVHRSDKICLDTKKVFEINVETIFSDL